MLLLWWPPLRDKIAEGISDVASMWLMCVRACVRTCVRACMHACVCVCVSVCKSEWVEENASKNEK